MLCFTEVTYSAEQDLQKPSATLSQNIIAVISAISTREKADRFVELILGLDVLLQLHESQTVIERNAPHIMLVGPPAAGKTFSINLIEGVFLSEWKNECHIISIEACQRTVCPSDQHSTEYYYNDDGALILLERERLASLARSEFIRQCKKSLFTAAIAECGQPNALRHVLNELPEFLRGALVLHITAPLVVRTERNALRGSLRMPTEVLKWIDEHLDDQAQKELEKIGGCAIEIKSNVPERTFAIQLSKVVRAWIIDLWDKPRH